MKRFILKLNCNDGKLKGSMLELDFEVKNAIVASEFAKMAYKLKTFNGEPVTFNGYELSQHLRDNLFKVIDAVNPKTERGDL